MQACFILGGVCVSDYIFNLYSEGLTLVFEETFGHFLQTFVSPTELGPFYCPG